MLAGRVCPKGCASSPTRRQRMTRLRHVLRTRSSTAPATHADPHAPHFARILRSPRTSATPSPPAAHPSGHQRARATLHRVRTRRSQVWRDRMTPADHPAPSSPRAQDAVRSAGAGRGASAVSTLRRRSDLGDAARRGQRGRRGPSGDNILTCRKSSARHRRAPGQSRQHVSQDSSGMVGVLLQLAGGCLADCLLDVVSDPCRAGLVEILDLELVLRLQVAFQVGA